MHVKRNDEVIVLSGKDKGKSGKIMRAFPKLGQVLIDGINVKKVHQKKTSEGQGKIVERAYPIDASNVRLKKQ